MKWDDENQMTDYHENSEELQTLNHQVSLKVKM